MQNTFVYWQDTAIKTCELYEQYIVCATTSHIIVYENGQKVQSVELENVDPIYLHATKGLLVLQSKNGWIVVYDTKQWKELKRFRIKQQGFWRIAFVDEEIFYYVDEENALLISTDIMNTATKEYSIDEGDKLSHLNDIIARRISELEDEVVIMLEGGRVLKYAVKKQNNTMTLLKEYTVVKDALIHQGAFLDSSIYVAVRNDSVYRITDSDVVSMGTKNVRRLHIKDGKLYAAGNDGIQILHPERQKISWNCKISLLNDFAVSPSMLVGADEEQQLIVILT